MTKWNLPLTYKPKIQAVLDGKCRQSIRAGRKIKIWDDVSFHGWDGKSYRSKWSWRTPYFTVTLAEPIIIHNDGIYWPWNHSFWEWDYPLIDDLAYFEHTSPPSGAELRRMLMCSYKLPENGLPAQIIRWF